MVLNSLLNFSVATQALLATQFNDFGKGPTAYDINYDMLGSGVFNSDGAYFQITI